MAAVTPACDVYEARLQVGRRLRGKPLAVIVTLRNMAWGLATLGLVQETDVLAPAWVIITRRDQGKQVARLAAGRGVGDGERLLASIQASLQALTADEFRREWDIEGR